MFASAATLAPVASAIASTVNTSVANSLANSTTAMAFNNLTTSLNNMANHSSSLLPSNVNHTIASTLLNTTDNAASGNASVSPPSLIEQILPKKGSAEEEHSFSMAIFFVLAVIASCIIVIHFILQLKINHIPESLAVVLMGAAIGLSTKLLSSKNFGDWKKEEMFNPTTFFLILLPPIMYESGYNLHKGNFFQNIGSILIFAIFGTTISALVVGGGVYLLGLADVAYNLTFTESFAFGSLISAVDPVATLAIFHALDIDPVLNMLVFGESILNDAVSIVLSTTALEASQDAVASSVVSRLLDGVTRFLAVFFGSAVIGVAFALFAALLFKHVDLRKNPSLEFGMMLVFIYAPYGLAEGVHLSGIMAILFNGIVMSHYTHFNLSPVTQITMQQTLRTLAFIAETCVFAYLGLALFSFPLSIQPSFIIWSIVLCLLGRAANIYPLAYLCNYFREHKISKKMMFIMWFSGMRGAVAYALALHLELDQEEKKHVIVTTTLIIVLFTVILLGGLTMPLMKFMKADNHSRKAGKKRRAKKITLSKTKEMGQAIEAEHLSEYTEEELDTNIRPNVGGFVRFDLKYLMPFFLRRFTEEEVKDEVTDLTNKWYQTVKRPT